MSNREAAAASERPLPPLPTPRLWIIPGADGNGRESGFEDAMWRESGEFTKPLYTAEQMHAYVLADRAASAPQAVRIPLTEDEIREAARASGAPIRTGKTAIRFARAIEAAHGIVPLAPQDSTKEGT